MSELFRPRQAVTGDVEFPVFLTALRQLFARRSEYQPFTSQVAAMIFRVDFNFYNVFPPISKFNRNGKTIAAAAFGTGIVEGHQRPASDDFNP